VATVKAEIKRGMLNAISRALNGAVDLKTGLEAFQNQGYAAIKSGKQLIASSGVGHSTTFAIPMIGSALDQSEFFALSQELLETYDAARSELLTAGTIMNATDPQVADPLIKARMMLADNMQAVTRWQTDYTAIRFPQTAGA